MANLFMFVKQPTICLLLSVFIYFIISKIIFDNVYLTSNMVVDEEFHIPLGHSYCELDFSHVSCNRSYGFTILNIIFQWDPKVTTLPGLYLISGFILSPFGTCSSYSLRFVSLLASIVNIFLFYNLLSKHEEVCLYFKTITIKTTYI